MSWPLVSIGSIAKVVGGYAFKSKDFVEVGSPIVRISNVKNGIVDLSKAARIPEHKLENGKKYNIETGSLLIAMSGATTGKVGRYFPIDDNPAYLNQRVGKFDCNESLINQDYLWFFTQSSTCQKQIGFLAEGAAQPNISGSQIESIEIPLPPLETQKKIAAVLEKADQLRKDCKLLEQELNSLAQSVFIDMFGDPVTNPKGLALKSLSDVANVVTGNTPSRAKSEYYGSDIEWIKSGNINTPSDFLTTAEEHLSEAGKKVGRVVQSGSILMTCIAGSPDCIGNIAMADREVTFNQQINALVPKSNKLNAEFLFILLKVGKKVVQSASTNSMKGMISKSKLESIKLPFPSYNEQCDFSEIYVKLQKSVKAQAGQVVDAELFFNSLMQKAFKGELNL